MIQADMRYGALSAKVRALYGKRLRTAHLQTRIKARPEEARRHLDEALLRRVSGYFLRHAAGYHMCVVHTDRAPEEAFADVRERLDVLYRGE